MYISQIPNIEKNTLKDKMTVAEFSDYTQVNVHTEKQEGDIAFNIALIIRTRNTFLISSIFLSIFKIFLAIIIVAIPIINPVINLVIIGDIFY